MSLSMKLIYVLIALQVLDAVTTIIALRKGATESNKLLNKIFAKIGVLPGLLITKLAVACFLLYFREIFQNPITLVIPLVAYTWVVFNNFKVIKKRNG